jgi:hypothetical protein
MTDSEGRIRIRASALSTVPDCTRRVAAKIFADDVRAAGYTLRELPPGIGAGIGQGCHDAAAYALGRKIETGELGNETEAEQRGLERLSQEVGGGCIWDATSPDLNIAQKQVLRMTRTYRKHVAPTVEPVAVEEEMTAPFGEDILVTGHADCREPRRISDLKTGTQRRVNGYQYGTYSLLARANGHEIDELVEHYVPRVRVSNEQPQPESHPYNVADAEIAAYSLIRRLADDLTTFRETGEVWSFIANPMSVLCSDKFCPAWGTEFCRDHKR